MSEGGFIFIVNPQSAAGATRRLFERVRGRYQAALPNMEVRLTERRGHATELARAAVRAGAEVVISVGGDGTNNEVVGGFFDEAGERIDSPSAFGVVTSGTGGDFRRTFGWKLDPLADLARLERNERRTIDVGRARFVGHDGTEQVRMFLNAAGFGVSGAVCERVNTSSKMLGGKGAFLLAAVRSLASYRSPKLTITIDDEAPRTVQPVEVAVANARYYGGGMKVAPAAEVDDGKFDLVMIDDRGPVLWARHGLGIYSGKHADLDAVDVVRCERVRAAALQSDRVPLQLDGESVGRLPLTLEIVAGTLELLV